MSATFFPRDEDNPLGPPPQWFLGALTTVCILPIMLPAGLIRLSSGALIFSFVFYLAVWTRSPTNQAYVLATSVIGLAIRWLDLVAIHKPENDFWRKSEAVDEKTKSDGHAPNDLRGKLRWFSGLWISQRGIGWNIEPANLPSFPKDYSKSLFIKQTVSRSSHLYIGIDILQNIHRHVYASYPEPFFAIPFHIQIFLTWCSALETYYGIDLIYSIGALITIIPGFYKPADWPPISGSFRRDAWSVRKMWGNCWHQMMRRQCSEAGRIVKEISGFKKGSFLSRYSQIWVAFAVSTVNHHMGAVVGCFEDGGWNQAIYFMVQPVGIMLEDGVMGLGKMFGIRNGVWVKRLGFLWVFLWFSFWIRYLVAFQPRCWSEDFQLPSLVDYTIKMTSKQ